VVVRYWVTLPQICIVYIVVIIQMLVLNCLLYSFGYGRNLGNYSGDELVLFPVYAGKDMDLPESVIIQGMNWCWLFPV
jgi:hypothetical protein